MSWETGHAKSESNLRELLHWRHHAFANDEGKAKMILENGLKLTPQLKEVE